MVADVLFWSKNVFTLIGQLSTCVHSSIFPIIYLIAKDTMLYSYYLSFRGKEGTKEAFTANGVVRNEDVVLRRARALTAFSFLLEDV